jgi:predicted dinucleotide-binding enzyme
VTRQDPHLRIGIVGAGKLGMTLAQVAVEADLDVGLSSSGALEELAFAVQFLAPGARAGTPAEVVRAADVVVLAVPYHRFQELDPQLLDGKVVVDAMNYWAPVDGELAGASTTSEESSLLVQAWFAGASVVRSLNQLGYHDLEELRLPSGGKGRVAQAVAGDDPVARAQVAALLDRLGFDSVNAGVLAESRRLGPGTAAFGAAHDAGTLRALLAGVPEVPVRSA